ncbi:MAG: SUMF1/EgtB/PvdO family nonheme iron enzyme [Spirochaetaceae bacterium]|jgi:formylglycine-generating enzyme required for sulfatase activity|nr:SUMF1/EgtB/PvdO family nonheme iron enzyme [Spirochaetaceae bacterium]
MVRTMKNVAVFITALALVAGMLSCENWMIAKLLERNEPSGGGNGGGGSVERVEITNGTERGGGVESALVIKTEVYPANATNRDVKWSSDDPGIADVVGTANGATVTLLGVGSTKIRVKPKNGGKEAVCTITVVSAGSVVPVKEVKLEVSTLSLQVWDHPVTLIATVLPANATDKGVEWSSSDESVVHVENGMLWALKAGPDPATITAKSTSNPTAGEGTCNVTVNAVTVDKYKYMPRGIIATGNIWSSTVSSPIPVAPVVIGRTEVRYELWSKVKQWGEWQGYVFEHGGRAGHSGTGEDKDQPVTEVSWRDVVIWCNAYSEMAGKDPVYRNNVGDILRDSTYKGSDASQSTPDDVENLIDITKIGDYDGYRLPTATEWEYAARGGVPSSDTASVWAYQWAGSNTANDVSWNNDNSGGNTHPVGQKAANSAELYDMSGNVWEWCFDIYSGRLRVYRGGCWINAAEYCSVAYRYGNTEPYWADPSLGFRLVYR